MQEVQARRRLGFGRIPGTGANVGGGKKIFARLRDGGGGEVQPQVDLRGINLRLLRRQVDADASAMRLARPFVRGALLVGPVAMLAAIGMRRRRRADHSPERRTQMRVMPAATPETMSDESRRCHDGQKLPRC